MSVKTAAQLIIDVNTFLPDNTSELISASDERDRFIDIIDSYLNKTDFFTGLPTEYTAGDGTIQAFNFSPLWNISGNTLAARAKFGATSGDFGFDIYKNNVVEGGLSDTAKWYFGTNAALASTFMTLQSDGNDDSTFALKVRNSDLTSLFEIVDNSEININGIKTISQSGTNDSYIRYGIRTLTLYDDTTQDNGIGSSAFGINVLENLPTNIQGIGFGVNVLRSATGSRNFGFGSGVGGGVTTGTNNILMGISVGADITDAVKNIVIGQEISGSNYSNTLGFGHDFSFNKNNQIKFGGVRQYREVFFGDDVGDEFLSPNFVMKIASIVGATNGNGWDWVREGSKGTGTGVGGAHIFQVSKPGGSGTSTNALTDILRLEGTGNIGLNGQSYGSGAGVVFMANAGTDASANPTGGSILQAKSGRAMVYETDGALSYLVKSLASTKTTGGAPYTNDGYVEVVINGTTLKLMTTA